MGIKPSYQSIKLYKTVAEPCPYLPERQSCSIIVDPDMEIDNYIFSSLSKSGFRRSGEMLYKPRCEECNACISVRIPTDTFNASRSQKRVWKRNLDIDVVIEPAEFKQQHFELYIRYQQARHPDSSMCNDDPSKYRNFIMSRFSGSEFHVFYLKNQLIGVCVTDRMENGVSAVYSFFEPELQQRSLGTLFIMHLVKYGKLHRIPYVYLGYWVEDSQKMDYKSKFRPLQGYVDGQWQNLD